MSHCPQLLSPRNSTAPAVVCRGSSRLKADYAIPLRPRGPPQVTQNPGLCQVISRILYTAMAQYQLDMLLTTSPSLTISSDTVRAGGPTTSESSGLSRRNRWLRAAPAAKMHNSSSNDSSPSLCAPGSTSSSDDHRPSQGRRTESQDRKVHPNPVPGSGDNVSANRVAKKNQDSHPISGDNVSADRETKESSNKTVVLPVNTPSPPIFTHIGDEEEDDEGTSGVYEDDEEIWNNPETKAKTYPLSGDNVSAEGDTNKRNPCYDSGDNVSAEVAGNRKQTNTTTKNTGTTAAGRTENRTPWNTLSPANTDRVFSIGEPDSDSSETVGMPDQFAEEALIRNKAEKRPPTPRSPGSYAPARRRRQTPSPTSMSLENTPAKEAESP